MFFNVLCKAPLLTLCMKRAWNTAYLVWSNCFKYILKVVMLLSFSNDTASWNHHWEAIAIVIDWARQLTELFYLCGECSWTNYWRFNTCTTSWSLVCLCLSSCYRDRCCCCVAEVVAMVTCMYGVCMCSPVCECMCVHMYMNTCKIIYVAWEPV